MEILHQFQEFINSNFTRIGFVVVIFIYLIALMPQFSSKIALQFMRFLILLHLLLNWLLVLCSFFTDQEVFNFDRATGPYATMYLVMLVSSLFLPFVLCLPKLGSKVWVLFLVSLLSNVGFWMERWIIILTSIHRDYLPPGHSSEIDFMVGIQILVLVQSLFIAVIFVLIGTWWKNRIKKLKLKSIIS